MATVPTILTLYVDTSLKGSGVRHEHVVGLDGVARPTYLPGCWVAIVWQARDLDRWGRGIGHARLLRLVEARNLTEAEALVRRALKIPRRRLEWSTRGKAWSTATRLPAL